MYDLIPYVGSPLGELYRMPGPLREVEIFVDSLEELQSRSNVVLVIKNEEIAAISEGALEAG